MLRYAICKRQELALIEYRGELDFDTMVRYMNVIWDDPETHSHYSGICDFSQVQLKMSSQDMERLFFYIMADERSLKGPCALVITTPMETALGFIFKHISEQAGEDEVPAVAIQIFHEWENACGFVNCLADKSSFNWKVIE